MPCNFKCFCDLTKADLLEYGRGLNDECPCGHVAAFHFEHEPVLPPWAPNQNPSIVTFSDYWRQIEESGGLVHAEPEPEKGVWPFLKAKRPKWLGTIPKCVDDWKKANPGNTEVENCLHSLFVNLATKVPPTTRPAKRQEGKNQLETKKLTNLCLIHTSSAYIMRPDFTLVPNGRDQLARINAVAFIEICVNLDSNHKRKLAIYNEKALTAQSFRPSIVSALTDLTSMAFLKTCRTENGEYETVCSDEYAVDSEDGFAHLNGLLQSSAQQLGWNIPTFNPLANKKTITPINILGVGASAVVFEVKDDDKNTYALKSFDLSQQGVAQDMEAEVRWLKKLKGKIAPLALVEQCRKQGSTQNDALLLSPVGKPTQDDGLDWAQLHDMCEVVKVLVRAGCVHRDLSTRHFLKKDQDLFLIDYGFAVEAGTSVPFSGSSQFAPKQVLHDICEDRGRRITWSVCHNVESLIKVLYARFFPMFRIRLYRAKDVKSIRKLWEREESGMGGVWQNLLEESRQLEQTPAADSATPETPENPEPAKRTRQLRSSSSSTKPFAQEKPTSAEGMLRKKCCTFIDNICNILGGVVAHTPNDIKRTKPQDPKFSIMSRNVKREEMAKLAQLHGLVLDDSLRISGAGNCFPASVAYLAWRMQNPTTPKKQWEDECDELTTQMRKKLVAKLRELGPDYVFPGEVTTASKLHRSPYTYEHFLKVQESDRVWMEQPVTYAAAILLGCDITVVSTCDAANATLKCDGGSSKKAPTPPSNKPGPRPEKATTRSQQARKASEKVASPRKADTSSEKAVASSKKVDASSTKKEELFLAYWGQHWEPLTPKAQFDREAKLEKKTENAANSVDDDDDGEQKQKKPEDSASDEEQHPSLKETNSHKRKSERGRRPTPTKKKQKNKVGATKKVPTKLRNANRTKF